jgi:hypothetical protein
MVDYEVQRCTRHCATSGRELREGEEFFSALVSEAGAVRRIDVAAEHWRGPPAGALGSWKSRMPDRGAQRARLAPSEVLLQLFAELEGDAANADMRYVLALLLVRRRIMRIEEAERSHQGSKELQLYCPRDESRHFVAQADPPPERIAEIQQQLSGLLFADAT